VDSAHTGCHDLVPSLQFPNNHFSYEACGNPSNMTEDCNTRPAYHVLYRTGGYWMFEEMFHGGRALASILKDKRHPQEIDIWGRWRMYTEGNVSIVISSIGRNKAKICEDITNEWRGSAFLTPNNEENSSSTVHILIIVICCLLLIILIVVSIVIWICVKTKKAEDVDWNPEYGNVDNDPEYQESVIQDQNDYYDVED
jgi:hypothetical protein